MSCLKIFCFCVGAPKGVFLRLQKQDVPEWSTIEFYTFEKLLKQFTATLDISLHLCDIASLNFVNCNISGPVIFQELFHVCHEHELYFSM